MLETLYALPRTRARLRAGPLGLYIDAFLTTLAGRGYTRKTLGAKSRCVGALSRWMDRLGLTLAALDEDTAEAFRLQQQRSGGAQTDDRGTLRLLLDFLRKSGIVRDRARGDVAAGPGAELIAAFESHLMKDRGYSSWTGYIYTRVVRDFLAHRFGGGPVDPRAIEAKDISPWILKRTRGCGSASAKQAVTSLRAFLRFLRFAGYLHEDLASCVPKVPAWRLAPLPGALDPGDLDHLFRSSRIRNALGYRDLAILLLLGRLGLRAGEVAALTLDDVDWDAGEIAVHGKGGRLDRMPLPPDVGVALANYLRHGRRRNALTRTLFVRAKAPYVGFSSSSPVATLVKKALRRAGLNPPRKGAHLLRHSPSLRRGGILGGRPSSKWLVLK